MKTNQDKTKGVHIKYKRVMWSMPVCPDCDTVLTGNNSMLMPYECSKCKVKWVSAWPDEPFLYIKKPRVLQGRE